MNNRKSFVNTATERQNIIVRKHVQWMSLLVGPRS